MRSERSGPAMVGSVCRGLVALLLGAGWLVVTASSAAAHGEGTVTASFRSVVRGAQTPDGVSAEVDGIRWEIVGGDALLAVDNDTDRAVVVSGYDGEPYLRVGPDGAFENRNAPAAYRNDDRYDMAPVPAHADADAPPAWVRLSTEPTWRWHDHRVHWMAPSLPPPVRHATRPVDVFDWRVPFSVDGRQLLLNGTLRWFPQVPAWPWVAVALAAVVAPVTMVGATTARGRRRPHVMRAAAAVVLAVSGATVAHLVLAVATFATGGVAWSLARGIAILLVAVVGARVAWMGGAHAAAALWISALVLAFGIGVASIDVLSAPIILARGPAWFARVAVAATLVVPAAAALAVVQPTRVTGGEP